MTPPIRMVSVPVDELAQEIRRVDGNHSLGAGALAEALLPFLSRFTAAPVREEGGAVDGPEDDELPGDFLARVGMDGALWADGFRKMALKLGYSDMDEGWLIGWFCNAVMAGYDHAQRRFDPALATREEAPAEAGEIGAEYDTAAHCVTLAECPPGLFLWNGMLGFKSEYGAMKPDDATSGKYWKVGNQPDAYCADSGEYFWGGASNENDRAKLLVYPISAEIVAMVASHGHSDLRAQPQAREDAQPVAKVVRLGFSKGGISFTSAGNEADLPDGTPLFTHPAPDALREDLNRKHEACQIAQDQAMENGSRAREAERKLAEAVELLKQARSWAPTTGPLGDKISAFLSKEAERG